MNTIISRIFKNRIADEEKLLSYGFTLSDGKYFYNAPIADGEFLLNVEICGGEIDAAAVEADTNEPYTLFLVEGAEGSFVGQMRAEYERALSDIAEKCFIKKMYGGDVTNCLIEYVRKKYGDGLEFLWKDENAVWRRKDTGKWYATVFVVKAETFKRGGGKIEVMNVRARPEVIDKTVDGVKFFRGWHMNKKHWITVLLDGSVGLEQIFAMVDNSYALAVK